MTDEFTLSEADRERALDAFSDHYPMYEDWSYDEIIECGDADEWLRIWTLATQAAYKHAADTCDSFSKTTLVKALTSEGVAWHLAELFDCLAKGEGG